MPSSELSDHLEDTSSVEDDAESGELFLAGSTTEGAAVMFVPFPYPWTRISWYEARFGRGCCSSGMLPSELNALLTVPFLDVETLRVLSLFTRDICGLCMAA